MKNILQRNVSLASVMWHALTSYASEQPTAPSINNCPPAFPTPGSNRKAAKRRSGTQYRHGKAARK